MILFYKISLFQGRPTTFLPAHAIHVRTFNGGQHNSDLLGLSTGLKRSIIMYTYNIVSTILLCTQLI